MSVEGPLSSFNCVSPARSPAAGTHTRRRTQGLQHEKISPRWTLGQRTGDKFARPGKVCSASDRLTCNKCPAAQDGSLAKVPQPTAQGGCDGEFSAFAHDSFEIGKVNRTRSGTRSSAEAIQELSIGSLDLRPGTALHDFRQSPPRPLATANSLGIAAKAVILGIGNQSSPHCIQIDVCSDGLQGVRARLDEHTLEAFRPKRAETTVRLVEPDREPLLQQLHILRDVAHQRELATTPYRGVGRSLSQSRRYHLEPRRPILRGPRMEQAITSEQFRVRYRNLLRNIDEYVKVIRQNRVGENLDPAESRDLPDLSAQHFPRGSVDDPLAVNRAADAVVGRRGFGGMDLEARLSHPTTSRQYFRDVDLGQYPIRGAFEPVPWKLNLSLTE